MYTTIMVPVDLEHPRTQDKALDVAADLARHWSAAVVYVGVGSSVPTSAGRTPEDYQASLEALTRREGEKHGQSATPKFVLSADPAADLERDLVKAIDEEGADLVVMASHAPTFSDRIFASNASHLLNHSRVSVFIIR